MIIVKLQLVGSAEGGFHTTVTSIPREFDSFNGFLPPLPPKLNNSFSKWRSDYREVEQVRSPINPDQTGFRIKPKGVRVSSPTNTTQDVKLYLNEWLNAGDSDWQQIRDNLISIGSQFKLAEEETRVLLDSQDIKLGYFPWQEWQLFEDHFSPVEIALRVRGRPKDKIIPAQACSKVRILLVVGRSDNINTNADLKVIQELEEKGAEVIYLMQPSIRELCDALWETEGYHIFIFTGHSGSDQDGKIGWIELNDQDSLSIEDFKNSLKASIDKGLQLAIFNSCDGLGLANQLGKLNLPRTIVMREPVPDPVAIAFLQYFFQEFTSQKSLFASVHTARKHLEHFNLQYPGAMWLPTLCIRESALEQPLTWQKLYKPPSEERSEQRSEPQSEPPSISPKNLPIKLVVTLLGIVAICLGIGLWLKSKEILTTQSKPCPDQASNHKQNGTQPIPCFAYVDVDKIPSGTWVYSGSTSWVPIRRKVDPRLRGRRNKLKCRFYKQPSPYTSLIILSFIRIESH
ncbi:MAG: CHAT domain-containing protein [Moorea sp. SIO3F7]|nr:CHAT domain-containing protein [Moorena sp. SIO3E8]NEQ01302.1 CHAT domain-containing protein [Moorena sp. SIO3F7]